MLILYTLGADERKSRDARIEALIARMAEGDSSAIGGLYELIKTDLYAYALSRMVSREDAEDITHDTFVQIWQNAAQYKPQGKPMAWIITIELNLIRRKYNRAQRTVSFDDAIGVESDEGAFEQSVINNAFLKEIMRSLSEEEREIIVLHIVSGLKHREIAKLLDKPLSTVLSKYNRSIKKLQLQIKKGGNGA